MKTKLVVKKELKEKKSSWNTCRRSRARWSWKQTKSRGSIQGCSQPGWALFWGTWCGWNGGAGRRRSRWTSGGSPNARWVWKQKGTRGGIRGLSQKFGFLQAGWVFFWGGWCGWNGGICRTRFWWTRGEHEQHRAECEDVSMMGLSLWSESLAKLTLICVQMDNTEQGVGMLQWWVFFFRVRNRWI